LQLLAGWLAEALSLTVRRCGTLVLPVCSTHRLRHRCRHCRTASCCSVMWQRVCVSRAKPVGGEHTRVPSNRRKRPIRLGAQAGEGRAGSSGQRALRSTLSLLSFVLLFLPSPCVPVCSGEGSWLAQRIATKKQQRTHRQRQQKAQEGESADEERSDVFQTDASTALWQQPTMATAAPTAAAAAAAVPKPAGPMLTAAAPSSATAAAPVGLMVTLPSDGGGGNNLALSAAERRLFCSHSVAALKQIAEDKRNASEDKKEELRQLVGSANTRTHVRAALHAHGTPPCSAASIP